ncbi:4a-hydroxytetrahydrobiopterin dehydratase [Chondromyces crocatus]|uniref:Putative pterin-4-alpha-carbinolamine dehydratase n=1 Tax=Chondromyces crocatus TaxID=52 RepID=A0A0K1ENU2_CHOCO|nr:4a-hydroxytetrahydrobiopterin dehydratase [Chondromyces crocatus]AKT42288.1 pterin-4-alpha-carbinolamine dehydratase [Chondromyces crocatus]
MSKREQLSGDAIASFVGTHPGWERAGDALERVYPFPDYSAAVGFVMRVALAAERRDHHPDLLLSWGKVKVSWSTHDAGGITGLDTEMAALCDRLSAG